MSRPFLAKEVDRYGDCARVRVYRIDGRDDGGFSRRLLADYETLSRGATASARKEMRKLEKEGALA